MPPMPCSRFDGSAMKRDGRIRDSVRAWFSALDSSRRPRRGRPTKIRRCEGFIAGSCPCGRPAGGPVSRGVLVSPCGCSSRRPGRAGVRKR
jgi:hypothetical protein